MTTLAELVESHPRLRDHGAIKALPRPSETYESTSADAPWRKAHTVAVAEYLAGKARPEEAAPLALLDALQLYATAQAGDPDNLRTPILGDLIDNVGTLLSYDIGRLDAGTLDSWTSRIAEALSWNRDLSEISWPEEETEPPTYRIDRHYEDDRPRETIETGLTLEEAQAHCQRDDTSGPGWFDGYYED